MSIMTEDVAKDSYIGVPEDDGRIRLEGPLTGKGLDDKMKAEKGTAVGTIANNQGHAALKVIIALHNNEQTKSSKH